MCAHFSFVNNMNIKYLIVLIVARLFISAPMTDSVTNGFGLLVLRFIDQFRMICITNRWQIHGPIVTRIMCKFLAVSLCSNVLLMG